MRTTSAILWPGEKKAERLPASGQCASISCPAGRVSVPTLRPSGMMVCDTSGAVTPSVMRRPPH